MDNMRRAQRRLSSPACRWGASARIVGQRIHPGARVKARVQRSRSRIRAAKLCNLSDFCLSWQGRGYLAGRQIVKADRIAYKKKDESALTPLETLVRRDLIQRRSLLNLNQTVAGPHSNVGAISFPARR